MLGSVSQIMSLQQPGYPSSLRFFQHNWHVEEAIGIGRLKCSALARVLQSAGYPDGQVEERS